MPLYSKRKLLCAPVRRACTVAGGRSAASRSGLVSLAAYPVYMAGARRNLYLRRGKVKVKMKILSIIAFAFQIILSIVILSLFLIGFWGYDGSGGLKGDMYIQQMFYDILSIGSLPMVVFIAAPLSIVCLITSIICLFRMIRKKFLFPSTKLFILSFVLFFMMSIVNSFVYTIFALLYTIYNWFA